MIIDRGREAVIIEGQELRPAGNINLLSMQLEILLKSGNISSIHASTNRSRITVQNTSTNVRIFCRFKFFFFFFLNYIYLIENWLKNWNAKIEIASIDFLIPICRAMINSLNEIIFVIITFCR